MTVNQEKVKQVMARIKAFPGMPSTGAKLLKLLENTESTAGQIEDILRYDASLTANILKVTNSAYFGLPSKVSSVKQATVMLRRKRLLQLVMTLYMSTVMKKPVDGYELSNDELWRHSLTVSVAAEALVNYLKLPEAEEVFTAALLHDIGKLVIGQFVKEEMQQIKTMVFKGVAFEVAEYMVLGTNHAEVGATILEKWGFALELVNAVNWHHDPENCDTDCVFSDLVHVSNALGSIIGCGRDRERAQVEPCNTVIDRLGLKPAYLDVLVEQTIEGIDKLSDLFPSG